ncbi:BTAD domain-containing putative transcriptional regulator [Streptomyces sp. NPDC127020]|uniref:BTAD domain-containing putative transcriptional regulator n=1 Tax=Streptomyces sp. NPDC127020 TaxID=3347109 RepID=UPI00364CAC78
MRYGVLGPLAVWDAEGRPVKVPEAKVRALLADLLVHGGGPVPADRLIDDLWAGKPPGGSANTLQTKISQLRRVLGREQVVREPAGYRLLLADGALDAARFQELAERARGHAEPAARASLFGDALALWRGPAYADVAESLFARGEVDRLEELRLGVVEDRAEALLALGEHAAPAAELGEVVCRHPLRERLRVLHMRALYRAGRQGDALHGFQELRRYLAEELGTSPGPEVSALHEAMLRQDPGLAAPVVGAPSCRTNLPTPLTPLIGRRGAVETVRARLSPGGGSRLVTLTGLGGVGKTRLAIAAARDMTERFADGVWLVELSGLGATAGRDDIAERVITTLGLCDTASTEPDLDDLVSWLCRAVAGRQLLILLDNCEHLVEPVAQLAGSVLSAVPAGHLLVTSQEALGIPGELVHPVPPLSLPERADAEAAARSGAVELFVARAAAATPGFALDSDNAAAVSAICRRLDGIPLALELMAPRLRTLSADELAACLEDRLAPPAVRVRGLPERQRTLRSMLDWSWQLLSPDEQTVLRRLAVHADGCTLPFAETVCSDTDLGADRVADLLARLVDRSLVVREGNRFRLLESVAAYCGERLAEAGEEASVRARFVRCHTEAAEREAESLRGPDQRRCLERLDAETVNLRRALDLAVAAGTPGYAVRLVNALTWYWFLRGRLTEARRSLHTALATDGEAGEDGETGEAARLAARAWLTGIELRGSSAEAAPVLAADVDPASTVVDPVLRGRLRCFVGTGLFGHGRHREGLRLLTAGLAAARGSGDRWAEAAALVELALHTPAEGRERAELGAALFHEAGDRWGQLRATRALALVAERDGDRAGAQRLYRSALLMAEELGLWTEAVETLTWLGGTALADGDASKAAELYERALSLAAERAYGRGEARAEIGLGLTARLRGDRDAARRHLNRALAKSPSADHAAEAAAALAQLDLTPRV